ncbi:hypothetical protein GW17_00039546 [Ensete ventricosum]|uniref:Guanosine nucleotide diphosphate dissociation inhibitor n=1 Tax=Ensete ventricosum TaxID=4639 RepID=A0A444DHP9_ENSVE|nr:hypothetical protein B296_00017873 [Ensete ventricosum]RWV97651.1 hypothetical protein GW17_00039546 [Ensete ventricosum]RZS18873.1 hypothetical protein BHM03_00051206 [Ensete ventricosum]
MTSLGLQGFARLSAVYGGTYMLNKPECKVTNFHALFCPRSKLDADQTCLDSNSPADYRYVFCCSYTHNVAPKGKYIAFVSTEAETDQPETELKPGIDLLGPVDDTFFDIYDRYEPTNNHEEDSCFISTEPDLTVDLNAASAAADDA